MPINDEEYRTAVGQALDKAREELRSIDGGAMLYVEWLREFSPEDHATLLAGPGHIQRFIGVMPIKALAAFLDCQVATHRFWFAVWCEREEITKAMIERLTAGPGKVM